MLDVAELNYASYASVKAFAAKIAKLPRLDIGVLNAGVATEHYEIFEDNESTITVNVVSTALLILLCLPILRTSATQYHIEPVITVVGSGVHAYTKFPERKTPDSFATLNDEKIAVMSDRYVALLRFVHFFAMQRPGRSEYARSYQVSKLLQLFAVHSIAAKTSQRTPFVVLNTVNPGLCYTDLTRSATGSTYYAMKIMRALLAWTADEGSRTLVHAATLGLVSHGVFVSMCKIHKWVCIAKGTI